MNILAAEAWVLARKLQEEQKRQKRQKRRHSWARSWILRTPLYGQYEKLLNELTAEDGSGYIHLLRMDPSTFCKILARVGYLANSGSHRFDPCSKLLSCRGDRGELGQG